MKDQADEELLQTREALKRCQDNVTVLSHELEETNRGVVALYAELDEKATNLRLAQTAVEAAAQEWQSTFDAIGDGIALTRRDGKIVRCNQAFAALVGKPCAEIEGQECYGLSYCTPRFIADGLETAQRDLRRQTVEVSMPAGSWLSITVDPLLDEGGQLGGFVHVLTDITERRLAEDQLRIQANILQTINDAVIVSDLSYCLKSWNRGAERIYGWKEEEVLGRPVMDILRSEMTAEQRADLYQALAKGEPRVTEVVQYTREGHRLTISGYSLPLRNAEGVITGYVAVNQDITDRKQAESALQTYSMQLERSNRELQDFAYIASHDLQEPLRKVRGFSEILKTKTAPRLEDQEIDYINRMQNAAERMQKMIDDLLAYARVTTHAQPLHRVDLSGVAAEVISDLELRIRDSEGKVEVGDLPTIEADPLQMRQLFQNLIGNALKFHRNNVPPLVKVQSRVLPGKQVEITVEDNGIGFEMSQASTLFQPFRRLHSRSEFEGTGMGLSICRKIVERHGGSISARSTPGEGTTFSVMMPL